MSLAELRKELKEIRKSIVHPVSRMKKSDLIAELSKHKGSSTVAHVAVAVKEEVKVEAPVKKVAKEVAKEKVAAIKVPKEKAPKKKEKAAPKAKKETDPAPVKTEMTVLSKHMKSKD